MATSAWTTALSGLALPAAASTPSKAPNVPSNATTSSHQNPLGAALADVSAILPPADDSSFVASSRILQDTSCHSPALSPHPSTPNHAATSSSTRRPRTRALVAHHDGLLFVCSSPPPVISSPYAPVISVINLRQWKRDCAKPHDPLTPHPKPPIKQLILPELDFAVNEIRLNATGRLLAIAGDHDVLVAVLPVSIAVPLPTLKCETHKIGALIYSTDRANTIAKILWHPLGQDSTHLVVLASSACLYLYDIASDVRNPEQTIDVSHDLSASTASSRKLRRPLSITGRFGLLHDEIEAVSFCFGALSDAPIADNPVDATSGRATSMTALAKTADSAGSSIASVATAARGWAAFTIYVLMRNGDIVSVCPVVPARFSVPAGFLDVMAQDTALDWSESDGADTLEQSRFYWATRWVQELVEQRQSSMDRRECTNEIQTDTNFLQNVVYTRPKCTARLVLKRSGPYLIHPPTALSDVEGASDMEFLPSLAGPMLAVANSRGQINLYLDLDQPRPRWRLLGQRAETASSHDESALPVLTFVEAIDLELGVSAQSGRGSDMTLLRDNTHHDMLYAYHARGVHSITVGCFDGIQQHVEAFEQGDGNAVARVDMLASSTVHHLAALGPFDALDAGAVRDCGNDSDAMRSGQGIEMAAPRTVAGLVVISEIYLGRSIALLTSDNQLCAEMLMERASRGRLLTAASTTTGGGSGGDAAGKSDASPKRRVALPYASELSKRPYQMPSFFASGFPRRPKMVGMVAESGMGANYRYPACITSKTLKQAVVHVEVVREDLQALYNAKGEMLEHLMRQEHEQQSQLVVLTETEKRIRAIESSTPDVVAKLKRLEERQAKLESKMDLVLQVLVDMTRPELTSAELAWAQQLERILEDVRVRFEPSICRLREEAREMRARRQASGGVGGDGADGGTRRGGEWLGRAQRQRVREALRNEHAALAAAVSAANGLAGGVALVERRAFSRGGRTE